MKFGLRCAPGVFALALLACSQTVTPPSAAESGAANPATAMSAAPSSVSAVVDSSTSSAANRPVYDARVIHFAGYGPAQFLGNEESVRQAFGRPLAGKPDPRDPAACYYLRPETPQAKGYGIRFMFEAGRFVRYDVEDASIVAPGGLLVGMSADTVLSAFPGRVESQAHKYVEGGKALIVSQDGAGSARLVFEIDAGGTITRWRIGVEPQVHYVEGCS